MQESGVTADITIISVFHIARHLVRNNIASLVQAGKIAFCSSPSFSSHNCRISFKLFQSLLACRGHQSSKGEPNTGAPAVPAAWQQVCLQALQSLGNIPSPFSPPPFSTLMRRLKTKLGNLPHTPQIIRRQKKWCICNVKRKTFQVVKNSFGCMQQESKSLEKGVPTRLYIPTCSDVHSWSTCESVLYENAFSLFFLFCNRSLTFCQWSKSIDEPCHVLSDYLTLRLQ